MSQIRFEHKLLDDRWHVITSPDIVGFHVAGETQDEAFRKAMALVSFLRDKRIIPDGQLRSMQFAAE